MKTKIYEFNPVIYPFPLLVIKNIDSDEMAKKFWVINEKEENVEAQDDFKPNGAVTARVLCVADKESNKMYYAIIAFRPKAMRYGGIACHESTHLANAYLQYLGFSRPMAYDDEQYAYFGQWIFNCLMSVIRNEPELMNGKKFEDK